MGFDAKAFATAFINDQVGTWKMRQEEAREESKRKKEIARTAGMQQYNKRKALASRYKDILSQLGKKGMTQENLALLATNPATLAQLYKGVGEFEQQHGRDIKAKRLNDLITLSGDFSPDVDVNGKPISLDQQIKNSVGLYTQNYKPDDDADDEDNLLMSIMNINADERAERKLREQKEMDGLTTYDLYMMGSTGDYMPDNQASLVFNQSQLPDPQTFSENLGQRTAFEGRLTDLAKSKHAFLSSKIVNAGKQYVLERGKQGDALTKYDLDALVEAKLIEPEEKPLFEMLDQVANATGQFGSDLSETQLRTISQSIGPEAVALFANQAYDGNVAAFEFNPEFKDRYGAAIQGGVNLLKNAKNATLTITTDNEDEQREIIKKAIDDGTLNTGDAIYFNTPTTQELDPLDENTYNKFVDMSSDDVENADDKNKIPPDEVTIELTEFSAIAKKSLDGPLTKNEKVQVVSLVNELTDEYNELPEAEKRKIRSHRYIKDKLASSGVSLDVVKLALKAAGIKPRGRMNPALVIPDIDKIE